MSHPQAGVGDVKKDVDGLAGANQDGVLPHEVVVGLAVACEHEEPAGAVDVERVVHGVVLRHAVLEADLDPVADVEGQSMCPFSLPVSRSTSFHVMLHESEAWLISGMRSSHSRPSG